MSISVVIPAYNASMYLREAIDSALHQTLPPDEIIVVDDGSTDDTYAIAASYGPPVTVLQQTNHGLPTSRNVGARQANSEWIALLDADDVWEPNKLQLQMEELKRTGADICYTGHVILQHEGDRTFLGKVHEVPPAEDIRRSLFEQVMTFLPSSVVLRKATMFSVGGFDESMRHGSEDMKMSLKLLHGGAKFAAVREPLFQYRRHGANWNANLAWFEATIATYRELVYPHLPKSSRWFAFNGFRSQHESDVAYALRQRGDKQYLPMMAKAILHGPFHDYFRYKALLHMTYKVLRGAL